MTDTPRFSYRNVRWWVVGLLFFATGVETGFVVVPISLVSIATIVVVTIEISHW